MRYFSGRKGKTFTNTFLHEAGAIVGTDDGSPIANPELMRRVLEYTSQIFGCDSAL
ncbi:MAG: hypothetical protein R3A12_19065 [Ignavibacteria bacterium]